MNLEENIRRIEIIKILGDTGMCGEFHGQVNYCPMYAVDCPQTCTYAKNREANDDKQHI